MIALQAALWYRDLGWRVLPVHHPVAHGKCSCGKADCDRIGKHPRIGGGVHAASTDELQLKDWFKRFPNSNVGIATGAVSNLVVLDEDPRHGSEDSLDDLERESGPLPTTVEALTGGGGRHRLFTHPGVRI